MTPPLLDMFAAAALTGMLARRSAGGANSTAYAAYEYAEAMLREHETRMDRIRAEVAKASANANSALFARLAKRERERAAEKEPHALSPEAIEEHWQAVKGAK